MKAHEVIERILQDSWGDRRLEKTGDSYASGHENLEVQGVVTTFMATVDVIKQAIAIGANLIVTHEPTYFTGKDETDWLQEDPVYLAKKKLLDDNQIIIWRYHDYMHFGSSDRMYDGVIEEFGWATNVINMLPEEQKTVFGEFRWDAPIVFQINETPLSELTGFFKQKLAMDVVQIVGNPDMKCSRVGLLIGGGSLGLGIDQLPMKLMETMNLDVIICGEILEWTLCAYVNDAQMLGLNKAMIVLGHERSEEWGMKFMAEWLQPLVPEIPVTFVDAKEPFKYL